MWTRSRLQLALAVMVLCLLPFGCNCGSGGGPDGGDAGSDGGPDAHFPAVCGDGVVEEAETCDDGAAQSNDGCSSTCQVESGWNCPPTGGGCTQQVTCGNTVLETGETCDDGDLQSGDGCSASCQEEPGWSCSVAGSCSAVACGDGLLAGSEECDDGDTEAADGCSDTCRLENGFKCPTPGSACETTTCGDGVPEGTEQCDDGDNDLGDGCTPLCTTEPTCSDGTCTAVCGDGVILPGDTSEACDDGNARNGDGCSSSCTREPGFECELITDAPPETIEIAVVYRDFKGADLTGGHIDFENKNGGVETGIVETTLDADGKPVYAKEGQTSANMSTAANFAQWYRDVDGVNLPVVGTLALNRDPGDGSYVFDDQTFFPLDAAGWVAEGSEALRDVSSGSRNFSFTSEARYWFEYKGTEVLTFRGDDDVWVFINERLAVDIGGVHGAQTRSLTLSDQAAALGLEVGKIYEVVVFQAERHTNASSYRLTLSNFTSSRSECRSLCGNGTIDPGEECDDGNGSNEDTCLTSCRLACQALGEGCSPTQGCCSGLICLDPAGQVCDGTTSCSCDPELGLRPR